MPSEPLIALALSLLISLAPFLPAAEKSAPEEEPAPAVEEQPALSAEQLAALAQTPASWFDEPALLDALSKLPHYDETRAQRYLAYRTGGAWTLEQVLRIVNTDNDLPRFTAAVDADPDDGDLILVNKYSRLASDYVPEDLVTVEPAYSNGGKLKSEVNDAFCLALPQLPDAEEPLRPLPHTVQRGNDRPLLRPRGLQRASDRSCAGRHRSRRHAQRLQEHAAVCLDARQRPPLRLHPALRRRHGVHHRLQVRALALPLRRRRGRDVHL